MKANELRVGNWVNDESGAIPYQIRPQDFLPLSLPENEGKVKPIPLTLEILAKAGFDNFEDGWYSLFDFTWNIYDKVPMWMGVKINCHYLHQLQNLYFALTGKELNIEL